MDANLDALLASLAAQLPDQLEGLLDHERFADGRAALDRLADPANRQALTNLDPEDAAWLADELQRRWERVATPVTEARAWLELSDDDGSQWLTVRVEGAEAGWTVAWTGVELADDQSEQQRIPAPATDADTVIARVTARTAAGRVLLVARYPAEPGSG